MDSITPYLNKALRYLSFRPRSEKEIQDYLLGKDKPQKKGFVAPDAEIVEAVIEKLKYMRFLNDEEFAKSWVRSRTSYKPRSKSIVKMELRQKGISDELIEVALQERISKTDRELAIELLEKHKNKYERMEKNERYRKAGGFLARKGFSFTIVKAAIDEVFGIGV